MNLYLFIGLILVILLLFIFRNKSKKGKIKSGQGLSDNLKTIETTIVGNNYLQSLPDNIDSQDLIKVVHKIITIPNDYHELNKSKYQLVVDSGYMDIYEQITNKVIAYALMQQPHRTKDWVQWSEDQRVSEGWFLREDDNVWNIGEFSTKDGYKESLTPYANLTSACADFIKLQVEFTRQLFEADQRKKKKKKGRQ